MRAIVIVLLLILAGCAVPQDDQSNVAGDPEAGDEQPADDGSTGSSAAPTPTPSDSGSAPAGNGTGEPSSGGQDPAPNNGTGNHSASPNNGTGNQTEPQPFDPEPTGEPCNSLELVMPTTASPLGLVNGWPLQRLEVAMIADPYFVVAHPDDWRELLVALVEDASVHYEAQFGLQLHPLIIDALPPGSLDSTAAPKLIWDTARGFMHANHPGSEQDFVAVVLGADYNGSTAGQVQCVHGAYNRETAYLWTEYTEDRGDSLDFFGVADMFADMPLKIFMHEGAHLLAAHHHYTNCGEALLGYGSGDAMAVCGVMINDIGLASTKFSPTNRLVVRSFVEETGIGDVV